MNINQELQTLSQSCLSYSIIKKCFELVYYLYID